MRVEHPPYWFWRLDRWKLLLAALLALLALLLGLRGCGAPQAVAPTLSAPVAGARLIEGALGDVTGKAAPGAVVRFFDGDTLLGETTADGQGNLRFAMPSLSLGPHTITAATFDKNGVRLTTSEPVGFNVLAADKAPVVAPTLGFTGGQTALLTGKSFVATGTAVPAALIRLLDGDAVLGETTAGVDGNWTLGVPALAAGTHTLVVEATGADGISATSVPLAVTVAPIFAAPSIDVPADGLALMAGRPGVALSGTAAPGAKVQIFDGDTLLGEATAGPDGKWQFSLPALVAGLHTLGARVTNPDGTTVGSEPLSVEVAAPAVVAPGIDVPAGGLALTASAGSVLTGTAAPGARVQIFDGDTLLGETTAGPDGKWQFSLPALAAGLHNLLPRVTSPDGTTVDGEPLSIEAAAGAAETKAAPAIDVPAGGLALSADAGSLLTGTALPGAKVQIFDGDTLLGETTAGPDGKWQFSLPELAAGLHNLLPRVTNPDGTTVDGQPLSTEVGAEAAVAAGAAPTIDVPAGGLALSADAGSMLAGAAAPGAKVQIFDGDTLLGETTAGPDGWWRFSLPALSPGQHILAARTTNPDGSVDSGEPVAVTVGPADYPEPYRVTLGPNSSVSVPVAGFCLNYGAPFPGASLQAADALPDVVRKALAYAVKKGYADSDPWQTNLAVWALAQDKRLGGRDYTIADEIIRFAQSDAPTPELDLKLQSLYTALTNGVVEATLGDYTGQQPTQSAYSGKGTLVLRNLTAQTQDLLIPWGTRFRAVGQSGVQDMAILPLRAGR